MRRPRQYESEPMARSERRGWPPTVMVRERMCGDARAFGGPTEHRALQLRTGAVGVLRRSASAIFAHCLLLGAVVACDRAPLADGRESDGGSRSNGRTEEVEPVDASNGRDDGPPMDPRDEGDETGGTVVGCWSVAVSATTSVLSVGQVGVVQTRVWDLDGAPAPAGLRVYLEVSHTSVTLEGAHGPIFELLAVPGYVESWFAGFEEGEFQICASVADECGSKRVCTAVTIVGST